LKFTDVLVVLAAFVIRVITLMMEAASTSETSVYFYRTTWRNNPEDSHLHTCHYENLKSHIIQAFLPSPDFYSMYFLVFSSFVVGGLFN
jgi:hypothetical protein